MRPVGRPTLYREEFIQEMEDFFNIEPYTERVMKDKEGNEKDVKLVPSKFPTLARFATKIGITRETLHDWATAKNANGELKNPKFAYAYKKAKDSQEALLVEGAMAGAFHATFSIFTAKNVCGWKDKTEQEVTGADGSPLLAGIKVSFVKPNDEPESGIS